jgi:hypothetical protein
MKVDELAIDQSGSHTTSCSSRYGISLHLLWALPLLLALHKYIFLAFAKFISHLRFTFTVKLQDTVYFAVFLSKPRGPLSMIQTLLNTKSSANSSDATNANMVTSQQDITTGCRKHHERAIYKPLPFRVAPNGADEEYHQARYSSESELQFLSLMALEWRTQQAQSGVESWVHTSIRYAKLPLSTDPKVTTKVNESWIWCLRKVLVRFRNTSSVALHFYFTSIMEGDKGVGVDEPRVMVDAF